MGEESGVPEVWAGPGHLPALWEVSDGGLPLNMAKVVSSESALAENGQRHG